MSEKELLLKALGNESRLRILLTLASRKGEELTVYKIAKFGRMKEDVVRKNLLQLIEARLVERRIYGYISLYKLNEENLIVQKLLDFFTESRLL
jgi:DNA-binding transcriptional ArsR family regulator